MVIVFLTPVSQMFFWSPALFLHLHGPLNSFKYPEPQNIYTIPMDDILTIVDPRTRSGRVYSLTKKEMTFATEQLRTVSPQ